MGVSKLAVIREYFGTPNYPVSLSELKKLSSDERTKLAVGAAKELNVELESPTTN